MAKDSRSLWRRIKKWYEGEFIPPDNDPDDVIISLMGHMKRPFLALFISRAFEFSRAHWKWLIPTLIAFAGLMVAIF